MNLTVNNIQQYYGGSHILRDVSLEAKQGEVTAMASVKPRCSNL
jgi:urea transport system ATP-binding protein